ncbi:MAG TPA: hypothetical protein VHG28_22880 [Longimicrobiaceae bacterium]|nr:hypothetical protein [Longimicrobiaceae bacterium]
MEFLERSAVLTALVDALRTRGSWCGETHVQKAAYLLQELCRVPLGYEFILYKHGPFAFDLRDELDVVQGYGLLATEAAPGGYRPRFATTDGGTRNAERHRGVVKAHARDVEFVADKLGNKAVAELERLATALFITREPSAPADVEGRAERMHALKPHVSVEQARAAIEEIDRLLAATPDRNTTSR